MSKSTTWAQRVLAVLNLSEEGKVGLFENYAIKMYTKAIKQRKDAIAKLKVELEEVIERETEMLSELKAELETVAVSINLDSIKTVEQRESYFREFDMNLSSALGKVDRQEQSIKATKESIDSKIDTMEKEIQVFERKLSFFK